MRFHSTRGNPESITASEAINRGLAPDGGLYIPEAWPAFQPEDFDGLNTVAEVANRLIAPFFAGDPLENDLAEICHQALNFPIPTRWLESDRLAMLELFHGPTAAFKDVGARFLAACMQRLQGDAAKPLNILVATSGDTGGAVAAAFDGVPGIRVVVLYPKGLVSPRQEHQLCCWGENIVSLRVAGRFDDCQALVKQAFNDGALREQFRLSSANSISIGRLLPQMSYYAHSSLQYWRETGKRLNYIIPTGNVGNSLACIWARKLGLPIGEIRLATNANRTIPDYLQSGEWQPRESVATLASAMDVGAPSNMERLFHLHPQVDSLRQAIAVQSVSDEEIRQEIQRVWQRWQEMICPHTATAFKVWEDLPDDLRQLPWNLVATAHAAKFDSIVEPLLGRQVPLPAALADILERPARRHDIAPTLEALVPFLA